MEFSKFPSAAKTKRPTVAVVPIMIELVAIAGLIGIFIILFIIGTDRIPHPIPSSPE